MVMDPWTAHQIKDRVDPEIAGDLDTSDTLHITDLVTTSPDTVQLLEPEPTEPIFFEDNFQPDSATSTNQERQPFVKLPDSQEYLASLEKKLAVIQKGGKKGATAASILQSLSQIKESCMDKLLAASIEGESNSTEEFLTDDLRVNLLLKKIAPEKQAVNAEELVHLLKADQLEVQLTDQNTTNLDQVEPPEESEKLEKET